MVLSALLFIIVLCYLYQVEGTLLGTDIFRVTFFGILCTMFIFKHYHSVPVYFAVNFAYQRRPTAPSISFLQVLLVSLKILPTMPVHSC